jgi:hypothetical protein
MFVAAFFCLTQLSAKERDVPKIKLKNGFS